MTKKANQHRRIELNGTWQLRFNDGQRGGPVNRLFAADADMRRALPATVPGEVHLDLLRAGIIAEPARGLNALAARWVEETIWFYRRTFEAPALKTGERASLTFEGLDLAAVIYLNGQELGRHANSYYPCRLDASAALRQGVNVLVVEIEAGLYHAADRSSAGLGTSPDARLHKRPWLRKVQSSFSWDWAPRLLNVGITGNVYLDIQRGIRFDRFVALAALTPDLTTGTVTGRCFVEGLEQRERQGRLTLTVAETKQRVDVPVTIKPGVQSVVAELRLDRPELWWPIGHGRQVRYTVRAVLAVEGQIVARAERRVGFRHVRINQDPHPQGGRYFVIEINGKPIFAKGANFAPADIIFARIARRRYRTLIDRAIEANFNLLRVWGGGLYESDDFYDLCDAKGILVWQEFIFACAKYPTTDEHFLADIKREATWQIRRLAHHPSLIIWCGNNELEWGNHAWGYEKGVAYPDYALFHMVLPILLKQEDGTRFYQPSSPFSPDHEFPNRDDVGDQHPWSVGMGDDDIRNYRRMVCRFPNEGGTLGATALPTVRACLPRGQARIGSFAWEQHDNSIVYWGGKSAPDLTILHTLGREVESMSLEEWVYYAGVMQGEALQEYIRNFRRRMFDTAAAIFWQYNDCWPAVRSWAIVDYYLRRAPSFHTVRRAFAPCTVALVQEGGAVQVFGVNEGPSGDAELRFGLFGLAGGLPLDRRAEVMLPANGSAVLAEFPLSEWRRRGVHTHGAFAILSRGGRELARDRLFLPRLTEMQWNRARVSVRRQPGLAIFESKGFAWRVCLDLDGERRLPDNFFDVLPGIPTLLAWPGRLGLPKILRAGNG